MTSSKMPYSFASSAVRKISLRVLCNLLQGLAGVAGEDLVHEAPLTQDFPRVDLDIRGLPLELTARLMKQDSGMGKSETFSPCPCGQ